MLLGVLEGEESLADAASDHEKLKMIWSELGETTFTNYRLCCEQVDGRKRQIPNVFT